MSIGHSWWETELLEHVGRSFSLHSNRIVTLNWIILLSFLIKGDFTHDSGSELGKNFGDTLSDVLTASIRELLDLIRDSLGSFVLVVSKFLNGHDITVWASVYESRLLHFNHVESVLLKMDTEVILKHEKLLLEGILSLHSILMLDGLLPHSHELPLLEFLEEVEFLDMVVRISFDEPLTERQELDRLILLI